MVSINGLSAVFPDNKVFQHEIKDLLNESLIHEQKAIDLYQDLLVCSENKSLYIEEYAREMIKQEEMHGIEIKKMLRDYKE